MGTGAGYRVNWSQSAGIVGQNVAYSQMITYLHDAHSHMLINNWLISISDSCTVAACSAEGGTSDLWPSNTSINPYSWGSACSTHYHIHVCTPVSAYLVTTTVPVSQRTQGNPAIQWDGISEYRHISHREASGEMGLGKMSMSVSIVHLYIAEYAASTRQEQQRKIRCMWRRWHTDLVHGTLEVWEEGCDPWDTRDPSLYFSTVYIFGMSKDSHFVFST